MTLSSQAISIHDEVVPAPRYVARAPRYVMETLVRVRVGAQLAQLRALDISQGGIKMEIDPLFGDNGKLKVGVLVLVTLPGLRLPRLATVRWCRDGMAGVRFNEALVPVELDIVRQASTASNDGSTLRS